ncbi:unnamed protein product [Cladocopium goreaui]|uniref:Glucan endo-1,3-beta-glucosidase n=1 Tax=Cladocopium goreaui TaxID=2562237 RepID=A0A9P1DTH8_9DINO|nr:unnamed protein product [Cladocopium goreaui]
MLDALGARPACPRTGSTSGLLEKAFSCLRAGDGKQAEELFASAVLVTAAAPNVDAIYGMGVFLEVSHRHTEMLQWMDLAIELDPRHLAAWEARSRCQEHHGRLAEALAGYRHLSRLDGRLTRRRDGLLDHQQVYIIPMDVWSENVAEDLTVSARPLQTEWQENFQKPEPSAAPAALKGGVAAWDQVLNEELLRQLDACVDDHFHYIFTHRRVFWADEDFPGSAANMWLPSERAPRSAPEVAALGILQHVLQEDAAEFSGVEYWARVRSFNLGAAFHYDTAVDAKDVHGDWIHGNPWRPQWSCVLYLTDGGPTLVLDQVHCDAGYVDPVLPAAGHLCMARRNRLLIFRADLFHGSLPEKIWLDTDMSRKVFIFNFWRRHVPESPSCQPPKLARHVAMQRHRLKAEDVATSQAQLAEHFAASPLTAPRAVQPQLLATKEDFPHSSDLDYLPVPLPMPSMSRLCAERGFYRLDWLKAAAGSKCGVGASPVQVDPSPLQMTFRQPLVVIRRDQAVEVDMSPSFDPDSPEDHRGCWGASTGQRFQRPEAQKPAEPWDTATIRIAMSEKKGQKG